MSGITAQTLKGFRDFLPDQARKRQYVVEKLKTVFEVFGFEPLETPALEYAQILKGKYGEEEKLIYQFKTKGKDEVALRFDQTVPLARVITQYQNQLPIPFKRYQIQPVWRGENPQKGRFREFLQCDIDTVGSSSPLSDAEIIFATSKSLKKLGFTKFKIIVSDRNLLLGIPKQSIIILDKLKKIGKEEAVNQLVQTQTIQSGNPKDAAKWLEDRENEKPTPRLKEVFECMKKLGMKNTEYQFDPLLARGLDYYTSTIFEVEVDGYDGGSVAGGGRYGNLIGMFAGYNIPAVGVAFGFDRIIEAMEQLDLFPKDLPTTKVLVTVFSEELEQKSIELASKLRNANINTQLWLESETKLDKQLKYADQKGIPYVVIIGPDEAKNEKVTLKDLKTKTQETLSLDETTAKLTS